MARLSGNCSGLALLNIVDIATLLNNYVDSFKLPAITSKMQIIANYTRSHACGPYPLAAALNHYNATPYSVTNVTVDNNGLVNVVPKSELGR